MHVQLDLHRLFDQLDAVTAKQAALAFFFLSLPLSFIAAFIARACACIRADAMSLPGYRIGIAITRGRHADQPQKHDTKRATNAPVQPVRGADR
jgi:hypothetical protein